MAKEIGFFFGGKLDPSLAERIARGEHPRVEYLELLEDQPMRLLSFADVSRSQSPMVALARRAGGLYWGLAALGRAQQGLGSALTTGEDVGLPLALIQKMTGGSLPVFMITHGSYLGSRKGSLALRMLRNAPNVHFLCLSDSLAQRLVAVHRIPKTRVFNLGYGVDTRFFRPDPNIPAQPNLVVSAGMANRDYKTLAAAMTGLNAEAKIAADSAWFQSDLDIAGHELPPNVEARSYGDYLGLRRLYAEAACVVVPLYNAVHACGYAVIAEAMAMGKPVITTQIAGQSDYLHDGETGFYVPPGDADALRSCIQQLLENPALAAEMGRNARRLMEERYTLEAANRRTLDAMASAVPMPAAREVMPTR